MGVLRGVESSHRNLWTLTLYKLKNTIAQQAFKCLNMIAFKLEYSVSPQKKLTHCKIMLY